MNLPKDWKIVISSEIMDIRDGTHDTPKYVSENGIPLITSKNLKENQIDFSKVSYISQEDHLEISKRSKVENGDILFAMIGTIGNPETKILPEFFVNYLRSNFFEKQLNERKLLKGTTQKFIPLGNLRKIEIPLPPLKTQNLIVSKIEELFSELDKGIEELKKVQEQLKTYRQSVLKWAFEGRFTNEYVKDGVLPKGWKKLSINQIAKIETGTTPSKNNSDFYGDDYPFYKPTDLEAGKNVYKSKDGLTELGVKKARYIPENSTLVTCIGATIGKTGFIKRGGGFNQQINAIIPNKEIDPLFIYYQAIAPFFNKQILDNASATTLPLLNKSKFQILEMVKCDLNEQHKIVQEIESRLSVADKMEETVKTSLLQAESLRQSILKKAFSGELV
jgi:type I restriction enzyme S subunit